MTFESIQEMFDAAAARFPERTAISEGPRSLSYARLRSLSDSLAADLRRKGVTPGDIVAVLTGGVGRAAAAAIGSLKAHAAFMPLDAGLPEARLRAMLAVAPPRFCVADEAWAQRARELAGDACEVIALGDDWEQSADSGHVAAGGADAGGYDPEALSYIYFTSGSTGEPKAIAGRLKGIDHFIRWEVSRLGLRGGARVSQLLPLSFDGSLRDLFVPLTTGGCVCVPGSREELLDGGRLGEWLEREGVEVVHCVPSVFRGLARSLSGAGRVAALRWVVMAGEVLAPSDVGRWAEAVGWRVGLVNLYGTSETTMAKFAYFVREGDERRRSIPVGQPIDGVKALLVDDKGRPCPPGVVGEIYIRTPYRSRGYYNRPDLTAAAFIPNPFGTDPTDLIHRTGDMGRVLEDGNFEYLGRRDEQVKVRGSRVELGEVEGALRRDPRVEDCAVVEREDGQGNNYLCAYVVGAVGAGELREAAAALLPDYMVPSAFVLLGELPRTISGKVDRRRLPAPGAGAGREYVAPRGPAEEVLCGVWEHLLGVERVGVTDNFFELGGHSLLAMQLLSRVRTLFAAELPLRSLFESPTVEGLARMIQDASADAGRKSVVPPLVPAPRGGELPLSFGQQRMWLIYQLDPDNPVYNMHSSVRLLGPLDRKALERALNNIVRRHEALRTTFPALTDGRLRQIVNPAARVTLPLIDLSGLSAEERPAVAKRVDRAEAKHPFDLVKGPPMRAALVRLSEEDHVVLFTVHHIVSDGWSMGMLVQELSACYHAYLSKQEPSLPALPVQYADYAVWQRGWLQGEELEAQLDYWRRQLRELSTLNLPTDYPRPAVQTFEGSAQHFVLPAEVAQALARLSRQEGATLFMTVLAAFQTLLHRYTGQDDIVVGTPVANRRCAETENLIGFFVNTLVLRADLAGNPTFRELLRRVREVALGAFAHQDVPFDLLVEHLRPERRGDYTPFFQVCFEMENAPARKLEMAGLLPTSTGYNRETSHFDLMLSLRAAPEAIGGYLEYNTALFEPDTVAEMLRRFTVLLASVAADPEQRLLDIPLGAEEEAGRYAPAFDPAGHAEDQFIFN